MLFRFELKKLTGRPLIKYFFFGIVLLNLVSLWYFTDEAAGGFKQLNTTLMPLSQQERFDYVSDFYEFVNNLAFVEQAQHLLAFSHHESAQRILGQMQQERPGVLEDFLPIYLEGDFLRYTASLQDELSLIQDVYEEFNALKNYENHLKSIIHHGRVFSSSPLFENSSFSRENILRTISDYEYQLGTEITLVSSKGIRLFSNSLLTDALALFFTLALVGSLFFEEKQNGLLPLIKATPAGRLKTALAKLGALATAITLIGICLYGTNVIFFHFRVGYGELGRSIQSALPFMGSILDLSMGGYIGMFILNKGSVLLLTGLIASLVALLVKNAAIIYLTIVALFGLGGLLFYTLPSASGFNAFKYLNLWGFFQSETLLGSYFNLNVGGFAVNLHTAASWTLLLLLLLFFVLVLLVFCQVKKTQTAMWRFKWPRRMMPRGITGFEGYKLLVINRVAIIIGLFLWLSIHQFNTSTIHFSPSEIMYRHYMTQLAGEKTEEKSLFLESERLRFETLHEQLGVLNEKLDNDLISLQAFETQSRPIQHQLQFESVFWQVWDRYIYLQNRPGHFVYDTGFNLLFDRDQSQAAVSVLIFSGLSLACLNNVFAMEFKSGMTAVLRSAPLGRRELVNRKIFWAICTATLIFLITEVPRFILVSRYFGLNGLSAPAMSLPFLSRLPAFVSIGGWLVLFLLLKWGAACAMALATLYLSLKTKKSHFVLVKGAILMMLFPLLAWIGFEPFKWLSLIPVFSINSLLSDSLPQAMAYVLVMLIILFTLIKKINGFSGLFRK